MTTDVDIAWAEYGVAVILTHFAMKNENEDRGTHVAMVEQRVARVRLTEAIIAEHEDDT